MKDFEKSPVSRRVQVPKELREVMDEPAKRSKFAFRLALKAQVSLKEIRPKALRVFLNLPSANLDTAISDDHYVGTFALGVNPNGIGATTHPVKVVMSLDHAFKALAAGFGPKEELSVTLVVVPNDGINPPASPIIQIQEASLEGDPKS